MLYLSELHAEFVDEYGADPGDPGPEEVREPAEAPGRRLTTRRGRRWRARVGQRLRYRASRAA
jgi:hypothetical protein